MKFHWTIWIPRALMILLVLFMGMFSLDVFETKAPFLQLMEGFLIHNIPALVLLLVLFLLWKRPFMGGIVFCFLTLVFSVLISIYFPKFLLTDLLFFALPMLICAGLFFLAHYLTKKLNLPKAEEKPSVTEPDTIG
jgi:hypothetical protein